MGNGDAKRPPPGSSGGQVLSIADRIEQRKMARLREQSARMHVRKMETAVAWLDMRKHLETLDIDAQLGALAGIDTEEARRQRGEAKSLRGLQSCLRGDVEAGHAEWDAVVAEVPDLALPHFFRARWGMDTDPRGSLVHFDRAAELDPRDANVYWRRGDCYTSLGDHERALANYRRGVALDPESIDGLYATASSLVALGRPREALRYYDQAIARAPRYVDFHASRGIALEVLDEHAAAVRDYDRILEIDPTSVVARYSRARCHVELGETARAVDELTALAATHAEAHPIHLLLGKVLLKEGRLGPAFDALSRAIALAPDDADVWAYRGLVLTQQGERARARADLERAAELAPSVPQWVFALVTLRHEPGDHAGKIAALADPIARFPDTGLFLQERAELHTKLGDHARALADWDTLLASWPKDASCRIGRARSLGAMGRHAEALDEVMRARELDPGSGMAHALAANYRDHLGGDEALVAADWDRAVALEPDDVAIRYHRAHYFIHKDAFGAAIDDFDRVIALAPFGEAYYHRGFARYHLDEEHYDDDDWEEDDDVKAARLLAAAADFERALELGFREDDAFIFLHWAHRDRGDHAAAHAALDRGIEACPAAPFFFTLRHHLRREMKDEVGSEADRVRAEELQAAAMAEVRPA